MICLRINDYTPLLLPRHCSSLSIIKHSFNALIMVSQSYFESSKGLFVPISYFNHSFGRNNVTYVVSLDYNTSKECIYFFLCIGQHICSFEFLGSSRKWFILPKVNYSCVPRGFVTVGFIFLFLTVFSFDSCWAWLGPSQWPSWSQGESLRVLMNVWRYILRFPSHVCIGCVKHNSRLVDGPIDTQ